MKRARLKEIIEQVAREQKLKGYEYWYNLPSEVRDEVIHEPQMIDGVQVQIDIYVNYRDEEHVKLGIVVSGPSFWGNFIPTTARVVIVNPALKAATAAQRASRPVARKYMLISFKGMVRGFLTSILFGAAGYGFIKAGGFLINHAQQKFPTSSGTWASVLYAVLTSWVFPGAILATLGACAWIVALSALMLVLMSVPPWSILLQIVDESDRRRLIEKHMD